MGGKWEERRENDGNLLTFFFFFFWGSLKWRIKKRNGEIWKDKLLHKKFRLECKARTNTCAIKKKNICQIFLLYLLKSF